MVLTFVVALNGTALEEVSEKAALVAEDEDVLELLLQRDVAEAFSTENHPVSPADIIINSIQETSRRMLLVNVTANIPVEVTKGITQAELDAALAEVGRLSADPGIDMLANDPDKFFGRTTQALHVQATVTAPVARRNHVPEQFSRKRTWLDDLPFPLPALLGIIAGGLLALWGLLRARKLAWNWVLKRRLKAQGRRVPGGKKSKYELGSLGQAALTKLAKHKKEKAKTPLDRMWERRIAQRAYISDFKA